MPRASVEDACGVAAARIVAVEEPSGCHRPWSARIVGDKVVRASDRAAWIAGGVSLRPVLAGSAEQAVPAFADLEDLRHFQLPERPVGVDRILKRPGVEVWRCGEADGAAGVRLGDARLAGGEEHHPATLRVAHHPRVAHRPVMPVLGRVLLVAAVDVEREAVADAAPVVQVGRSRVPDPLLHPALRPARSGVEQVPEPVVALHHRAGPGGVVVPRRRLCRREAGALVLPGNEIAARRMALGHVEVA